MVPLDPGETISVKVLLAKPDAKWAVAASKDGRLFVVQVRCEVQHLGLSRVVWPA